MVLNGLCDAGPMEQRPTGTVTFLFTDVERSTRLWELNPVEMQAALERHDAILRSAIEGHGGYVCSSRRELLDRTIFWNQQQLQRLVTDYIEHYNTHRPHRTLNQQPPLASSRSSPPAHRHLRVVKSTRCGSLINEYQNAA
jgi:class 3 adenylate cyclase